MRAPPHLLVEQHVFPKQSLPRKGRVSSYQGPPRGKEVASFSMRHCRLSQQIGKKAVLAEKNPKGEKGLSQTPSALTSLSGSLPRLPTSTLHPYRSQLHSSCEVQHLFQEGFLAAICPLASSCPLAEHVTPHGIHGISHASVCWARLVSCITFLDLPSQERQTTENWPSPGV